MLKVAVIGGGSTYTPELVAGFVERAEHYPLDELWLADTDRGRLAVVGEFARRMASAKGARFSVHLTADRREAIREADHVLTQIRVGRMAARRADEHLGQRHGLIGQETTGVGGMANALRTIPVVLDIARDVEELARPGALLVNFTNPAGLVTQALEGYASVTSVGLCNEPINMQRSFTARVAQRLGQSIDPARTELRTLGLNHLTWHHGLTLDGDDVWPLVIESLLDDRHAAPSPSWDTDTIERLQMVPNGYLQYFWNTAAKLAEQDAWPPSRAEVVAEVEAKLLQQYADPERTEPPPELMQRGGAWYATAATQLLAAHHADLGETHVVNITNGGAVAEWPDDWVIEVPSTVRRTGITPQPARALPPPCGELVTRVKAYELLTVEAAVHGDRDAARDALLVHPLGPDADHVDAFLGDLLETHRDLLPRFHR